MVQHYRWQGKTLLLHCHLQPGAKQDGIAGIHGQRLKIRVSAPPVDGKANRQLVRMLSRDLGVAKGHIEIRRGLTGRQKTVAIVEPQELPSAYEIDPPSGPAQS